MDKTAVIVSIISALVALVSAYVQWKRQKSEEGVSKSQESLNIVGAAKTALSMVQEALEFNEKEWKEEKEQLYGMIRRSADALLKASADNNRLEDRIKELTQRVDEQEEKTANYRHEREEMIESLTVKLEEQGRKILEFDSFKEKYKQAFEMLLGFLDVDKREVAIQELAHILGDSVYKFKLPRSGGKK
jgi:predicted RNase H-like nuclease (RuvC/YqgF family)